MLNSKLLQHPNTIDPEPIRPRNGAAPSSRPQSFPAFQPAFQKVAAEAGGDGETNLVRKLAFRSAVAMLVVRVANLPELLFSILHVNTYLLYLVAPPAMLGVIIAGGVGRTFRHPAAWLWLGFLCCMLISLPFSSWLGGSIADFRGYAEFSFPLLLTVAGLTVTWSEVRSTFTAIGAAGVMIIGAARLFSTGETGRIEMTASSGTIGNSNDLASHLIFVMPFLLFIAMDRRRSFVIRCSMILPFCYAFWVIFGTASRGALIALAAAFLFALFRATAKQRIAVFVMGAALVAAVPFLLHGNAAERLASLFGTTQHEEAKESEDQRAYLLKQSLVYTLQHPVFGIGLGQFGNYEGKLSIAEGKTGNWHETHNCFTQVSSECGIPALIFFVLGIGTAVIAVNRVYRKARREGYSDISNTCFCYLLSMIGYMVSITFLANAFRFYLPLMIGLAVALTSAARREMSAGIGKEPSRFTKMSPLPTRMRPALS